MTTVVDASVVVDWVAPDLATTAPALALLDRLGDSDETLVGPACCCTTSGTRC